MRPTVYEAVVGRNDRVTGRARCWRRRVDQGLPEEPVRRFSEALAQEWGSRRVPDEVKDHPEVWGV